MAKKQSKLQLRDIRELTKAISSGQATPEFLENFKARKKREKSLLRQLKITESQLGDILIPLTQRELTERTRQTEQEESQLAPTRIRNISRREVRRTPALKGEKLIQKRTAKQEREKGLQEAIQEAELTGLLAAKTGEISQAQKDIFQAERPESTPFGQGFLQSPIIQGLLKSLGLSQPQPDVTEPIPEDQINEALGQGFAPEAIQDTIEQETIQVISPKGKPGTIPTSQLQAALKQGFKLKGTDQ